MGDPCSWAIVSTLRGEAPDILGFAAYHLDLGVDRLYLFLDEPNPQAFTALDQHPRVQVQTCDAAFWASRKRNRPEMHQVRQTANASFTYRKATEEWLAHIDVDEFLWPQYPMVKMLAEVPNDTPAIRVRPAEALSTEDTYKAHIPNSPERDALVRSIYPKYGAFVPGGFLSHTQGKLFLRTGMPKVSFRIHNLVQGGQVQPCKTELPGLDLCHRHAPDWDHWYAHFRFRHAQGSYRPDMSPNIPAESGGMNMHTLLAKIEDEAGIAGLKAFFDELSAADPAVHARLQQLGMIRHRPLGLDEKRRKHFPGSL